ncbi:hypothetical protein ABB37_09653 [Leptomonas pyrrhocoris]|uniref:Uncharacterized protein n=1 Tax=Leptomonas pyrrhocoris TaxID=157538 RepID=A0A0N1J476_LEPPY|nr:hypothetical protein ABB37_09653 [Leptomonas pyrrhocoris]KPA73758.1 hypothetical protein ABB37_09653 [Leptomonas pyrrhocoris]|eukprot:XP_015652197.1 hypothetical protein ABB37_09653 [Leptomonas pyrrhocoris]
MPGVDLLDAFAELVVCVVFNLPRDEPKPHGDSDGDEDSPAAANSSGTTQIFSRENSLDECHSQAPLQISPNTCELAGFAALHTTTTLPAPAPVLHEASSTQSLDLYAGGMWTPAVRVPQLQHNLSPAAAMHRSSHPSSVASLNTGDIFSLGSSTSVPSPDRGAGFWSRLLGSGSFLHTPPHTTAASSAGSGPIPHTGVTTNASSYVQLTEEDLGMLNASGRAGAASGWTSFSAPSSSVAQGGSAQQLDWNGGDSRGAPTPSNMSTSLYEASPAAPSTPPLPPLPPHSPPPPPPQQQQQQQSPLRLNSHDIYVAAPRTFSPQGGRSQASSSSDFIVL